MIGLFWRLFHWHYREQTLYRDNSRVTLSLWYRTWDDESPATMDAEIKALIAMGWHYPPVEYSL